MSEIRVIEVTCCGNCPYARTSEYSNGLWLVCGKSDSELDASNLDVIHPSCPLSIKDTNNVES